MSKNNNKIKAVILEKRGGATFCTPLLCMDVSISVLFLKFQIVGDCLMGTLRTDLSSGGSRISNIFSENSQHEFFFGQSTLWRKLHVKLTFYGVKALRVRVWS